MKPIILPLLASLLLASLPAAAQEAPRQVHYRKNIDDLTPAELDAFKHAVDQLKQKSQRNIFDRSGFLWQAWVHNCPAVQVPNSRKSPMSAEALAGWLSNPERNSCDTFAMVKGTMRAGDAHQELPGECEHQKDTFLQWHRAQLYYYEQALRAADPEGLHGPKTADVTLPYWNFTHKPSGVRFPKAFEDPTSPLFDRTRNTALLDSSMATASPYLLAYQIYYMDWPEFGGDQYGSNGGGALETRIHNHMHAFYIGGNMGDNVSAGLDPLFYVFHNFLDYSFEEWITQHGTDGITGNGRLNVMRSEQDANLPKPVGWAAGDNPKRSDSGDYTQHMGVANLYFDTRKQGYAYQPGDGGEFAPKSELQTLIDAHQGAGFVFGANDKSLFAALLSDQAADGTVGKPHRILKGNYTIPDQPIVKPARRYVRLLRNPGNKDYSFQVDVYLQPADVPASIEQKSFRDKYLVTTTSHWALSSHPPVGSSCIGVDVTGIINSLVPRNDQTGNSDRQWRLTAAVTSNDGKRHPVLPGDFTDLKVADAPCPRPPNPHH